VAAAYAFDYVGIILIPRSGLACLEVVLDRGERDDWLGIHFIATFLVTRDRSNCDRDLVGSGVIRIRLWN